MGRGTASSGRGKPERSYKGASVTGSVMKRDLPATHPCTHTQARVWLSCTSCFNTQNTFERILNHHIGFLGARTVPDFHCWSSKFDNNSRIFWDFFLIDRIGDDQGDTPVDPQKSKSKPGFVRFRTKFPNPENLAWRKWKLRKFLPGENIFQKGPILLHIFPNPEGSGARASDPESYIHLTIFIKYRHPARQWLYRVPIGFTGEQSSKSVHI